MVDDTKRKEYFRKRETKLRVVVPSGLHNRPDVFFVVNEVAQKAVRTLAPRNNEMRVHGLAITHYQHGIFVWGRNLGEAFDNLERAEANARALLLAHRT